MATQHKAWAEQSCGRDHRHRAHGLGPAPCEVLDEYFGYGSIAWLEPREYVERALDALQRAYLDDDETTLAARAALWALQVYWPQRLDLIDDRVETILMSQADAAVELAVEGWIDSEFAPAFLHAVGNLGSQVALYRAPVAGHA